MAFWNGSKNPIGRDANKPAQTPVSKIRSRRKNFWLSAMPFWRHAPNRIGGIGLGLEDAAAEEPTQWRGQNLMGFTLMAVRDVLRKNFTIE